MVTRPEEKADYAMQFVESSDKKLQQLRPRWEESLSNWFVRPYGDVSRGQRTDWPLLTGFSSAGSRRRRSILKDPESHQVVETYRAKLWTALFGGESAIVAKPVGVEDTGVSNTAGRLIEYDLKLPSHPRVTYVWVGDALIYGSGVVFGTWDYREGMREVRQIGQNDFGESTDTTTTMPWVYYDDPMLMNVDPMDFYPDPGNPLMDRMQGVARRFEMSGPSMLKLAKGDRTWNVEAIKRAISAGREDQSSDKQTFDTIKEIDQGDDSFDKFKNLIGYEYHGEVSWKVEGQEFRRQVLTVVNGELVRERHWTLPTGRVPAYDITINPVGGRFHGFSPLEVIHRDQDFLDGLKMNIADGVNLATNPPHIVDRHADVQLEKVDAWNPNVPILANHTDAIKTAPYDPPINLAMAAYNMVKSQEREGTGATGGIQGLGLGSKRFSATEAQFTAGQAMDRPEVMAALIEQNDLPALGRGLIALNQKFLRDDTDLAIRIGEQPGAVGLDALMFAEHDVKFSGSRRESNRGVKIANMERASQVFASNPLLAAQFPWQLWAEQYVKELDLPEIRAAIGTEQTTMVNLMLQMVQAQIQGAGAQGPGNGNGEQLKTNGAGNDLQGAGRVV